ncbi:MAG: hypothetical protein ACOYVK_12935 [Bacillota bacterium]
MGSVNVKEYKGVLPMMEIDTNTFVEKAVDEASDEFLMSFLNVSKEELTQMIEGQFLVDRLYKEISRMPYKVFQDYAQQLFIE